MLYSSAIETSGATWIYQPPARLSRTGALNCNVKIRYRQPDQPCLVTESGDGKLHVSFESEQRAVAPGQFAVFYDGDCCLGGAVIDRLFGVQESVRAAI